MPKHESIYHRDKLEFSWAIVNPPPQQNRAHGSDIFIEYKLDSRQKFSLLADWSLYCPRVMPLEKQRSERNQEFDGQFEKVAQSGVANGDVHLLVYAKHSLKKQQESV